MYAPGSQTFSPIPTDNGPYTGDWALMAPNYVVSGSLSYTDSRTQISAPFTLAPRIPAESGDAYWAWENGGIELFCRLSSASGGQGVAGIQTVSDQFTGSVKFYPGEGCWETTPSIGDDEGRAGGPSASEAVPYEEGGCDPSDDGSGSGGGGSSGLYCDVYVQWNWTTMEWDIVGIDWNSCEWRDE
jgi:hypothetical protein